jgi:superfamily II DNA or RNA helicase
MQPGDKVRLIANPGRVGILGSETDGPPHRMRYLVNFLDGDEQFVLAGALEKVEKESLGPYDLMRRGRYGRASDLRGAITYYRLSGKLANLIYSLNTTNTQFLAYQFKPVLQFLDSPSNGILIADEVGLGKTIEAGLIWTELRARQDARRLLVVCPAMLREKWKRELSDRFGVHAEIVDAQELHAKLDQARQRPQDTFALIVSMQGTRPPRGWNDADEPSQSATAKLARFLEDAELEEPLVDLVVIDEAHYLRNHETQTHRFGTLLRPVTHSMVMLSATPIQLRNRDLFNLLHLLDEDAFPFENSFDQSLRANAPIVLLRDQVLNSTVTQAEFVEALDEALTERYFDDNEQLEFLRANPPSDAALASPRGRSEIADQLDRINPLTKAVTRTLKRDVQENRVERLPKVIKATMSSVEAAFYDQVTERVRAFCEELEIGEGFMLTIPQRQMASCMAAACQGWIDKVGKGANDEMAETVYEIYGDEEPPAERANLGTLLRELVSIARSVGNYQALFDHDTKYQSLIKNLRAYWSKYPGKKVVLFSFYRNTLYYLAKRLKADGFESVVVHGGMDKQDALDRFERPGGPNILLSSEVAAEGVDLQFSSLVVNYDLPWNPAKIEQRIGRIDRIGQEESQILIWNLVYEDTVDERVYERLLERLSTFRQALGSMEAVLGDEIRELGYELLSHKLTPEQELERISRTSVTIETNSRQQELLEAEATHLIAHGEFIQNKVKAAHELGRYIRGDDLQAYVKDFLDRYYPGTRLLANNGNPLEMKLELSTEGRVHFNDFLQSNRLFGKTAILSTSPPVLLFDNKLGKTKGGVEKVTQDHPLVRFVAEKLKAAGAGPGYFPVSAVELIANTTSSPPPGIYVYFVMRWSVSGSRDIERLEYLVKGLDNSLMIDGDAAELLVNTAALEGRDWLGANMHVDSQQAASLQDSCRSELEERFRDFAAAQKREDADRIRLMVRSLEHHLEGKKRKSEELIVRYTASGDARRKRMIPAERGRLKKETQRVEGRIAELRLKEDLKAHDSAVSGGVIRVI